MLAILAAALLHPAHVQESPEPTESLLALTLAPLETWFPDPRDEGLLGALSLLDVRLGELPAELEQGGFPDPWMRVGQRLLDGAFGLEVVESTDPGAPLPFVAELRFRGADPVELEALGTALEDSLGLLGVSLEPVPGSAFRRATSPFPVGLGPDEEGLVLRLGERDLGGGALARRISVDLLGTETSVLLSGRADVSRLLNYALPLLPGAEGQLGVTEAMEYFGLTGVQEWAVGMDEERLRFVSRTRGIPPGPGTRGFQGPARLGVDDLRRIPRDATWANVTTIDAPASLDALLGAFDSGAGPGLEVLQQSLEGLLGISLRDDVLECLGDKAWFYASETTGGGGIWSTVGVLELRQRQDLLEAMARAERRLLELAESLGGYLHLSSSEEAGSVDYRLTTPGLPLPVDVTVRVAAEHLILGFSSHAVRAAARQVEGEGPSLLDHPGLRAQLPEVPGDLVGLGWIDTPGYLGDGYALTGIWTLALANGVRSPVDPGRGPREVLPFFHDLSAGALPVVSTTQVKDGGLWIEVRGDRSWLANAAGLTGLLSSRVWLTAGAAILTGAAVPLLALQQMESASEAAPDWSTLQPFLPHAVPPAGWEFTGFQMLGNGTYSLSPPQGTTEASLIQLRTFGLRENLEDLLDPSSTVNRGFQGVGEIQNSSLGTLRLQGREVRCLWFQPWAPQGTAAQAEQVRALRIDLTGSSNRPALLELYFKKDPSEAQVEAVLAPFDLWRGK